MPVIEDSFRRVLRPLARLMIARGNRFGWASDRLKEAFLDAAEAAFPIDGKRLTDSRISLLTGLQRKDIKALRNRGPDATPATGHGPLPRIVAAWHSAPGYQGNDGQPFPLPRSVQDGPSFETLVAQVSRDIHPRTVLDELHRQHLVQLDGDTVILTTNAVIPAGDDTAMLGYLGANLGDHAEATVDNLSAPPGSAPFFERAVHYNRLTPTALDELEAFARREQSATLARINVRALDLQRSGAGDPDATGRFRCGAFIYRADLTDGPRETDK